MSDSLRDRIQRFILENYLFTSDTGALGLDDSLLGRGIVDSTGMLEIIMFIEEQLGVIVRDEEMVPENLESIAQITAFVARKRGAPRARLRFLGVRDFGGPPGRPAGLPLHRSATRPWPSDRHAAGALRPACPALPRSP